MLLTTDKLLQLKKESRLDDKRNHPVDKYGMPMPRDCTCKNCKHRFHIAFDDCICPACGIVHCPNCLTGFGGQVLRAHSSREGLEVTIETTTCPRCGWDIFEYEH